MMKLIYTPASPFARKVRIIILEKQLHDRFELETVDFIKDRALLNSINPIGQVPVLIISEGEVVFDSPVICEFVDSLASQCPVFPAGGTARWEALTDQATADGLMEAAVAIVMAKRTAGDDVPGSMISRWEDKIHGALNQMDTRAAAFGDAFDIGQVSFLCAIEYLMLRNPEIHWRTGRPNLAIWFDAVKERPSAVVTRPTA